MITEHTIGIPARSVVSRILDGEAVLVHPGRGEVKVLNELGAEVWKRLDGQRSIHAIVNELLPSYDVTRELLARDVIRFVDSLLAGELILITGQAGPA